MLVDQAKRIARSVRTKWHYTLPGLWVALVFAALSFTPSLLPRPATFQGALAGINAAVGYGLGVLGAWVWREYADRDPRPPTPRTWHVLEVVGGVVLLVALVLGVRWQRQSARLVVEEPYGFWAVLLIPVVGLLVFVALVGLGRLVRKGYQKLAGLLERRMGHRAARATGLVLLAAVLFLAVTGVGGRWLVDAADASFAVSDLTTPPDVTRPDSRLRSGAPGSAMSWDSLGREGRVFTGRGPDAAEITELTGRDAEEPIRIFAGTSSADGSEAQADLAVQDLDRAGGFERQALLVVTTTGSGWVEPSAATAFEYLTDGDSAIVAMQYSHLPSWLSYLVDQEAARNAGRDLFDAVYERWLEEPAEERPQLYVFGESLGSFGGENAFSGEADLANRTDGALFVGPPNFNPLYRTFIDGRDEGSPEVEPVFRDGRTIRFATRARESIPPDGEPWGDARVVYLQHPSDPVTWWSPDLLFQRPDWLEEPRGSDVSDVTRWYPIISFWQLTTDLALGFSTTPGHGHNYSGEHVDAWNAILQPDDWTTDQLDELRTMLRRY